MAAAAPAATGEHAVLESLHRALNEHDLEAFVACFDPGYRSEQPAHPNRGFGGRDQVRANWSAIFGSIEDFRGELIRSVADRDTVWSEWRMHGTKPDGTPLDMRGVIVMGIRGGRIAWGRLYIEDVETETDIAEDVRRTTGGAAPGEG
jgi:ketosteroid isomerase-like protein